MKRSLNLLIFAVMALFAVSASAHPGDLTSNIYGWWQVQRPLADDPTVYSTGKIYFSEDAITFETTCSFSRGPELRVQASSPINYDFNYFTILQSQHSVTQSGNVACVADLTAGPIEYYFETDAYGVVADRLVIFNRNTGFRMNLVR